MRTQACCGNPYSSQSALLGEFTPRDIEHPSAWRISGPVDNAESRSLYYEIGTTARMAVKRG